MCEVYWRYQKLENFPKIKKNLSVLILYTNKNYKKMAETFFPESTG